MDPDEEEAPTVTNPEPSVNQSECKIETTDTAENSTQMQCENESVVKLEGTQPPEQPAISAVVEEEQRVESEGNFVGGEEESGGLDGDDGVVTGDCRESSLVEEDGKADIFLEKTDKADVIDENVTVEGAEVADMVEKEQISEEKNVSVEAEHANDPEETVATSLSDEIGMSREIKTEPAENPEEKEMNDLVDGGGNVTVKMQTEFPEEKGETNTDDQRGILEEKQVASLPEQRTQDQVELTNVDEKRQVLEEKGVPVVLQETGVAETDLMREGEETLGIEVSEVADGTEIEECGKDEASEMENAVDDEDKEEESETEEVDGAEGTETAEDTEMADLKEVAEEVEEVSKSSGSKRKRGKKSKAPSRKKAGEDVCFICFDGGNLVLCDRRGCPKTYHPSCVGRDEAFFESKGQWNCGVHICTDCKKNAYYLCYTCTSSLCKGCVKDSVFFPIRGSKGFCKPCRDLVMLIEGKQQGSEETPPIDFDDKSCWEYLFKDYWIDLKSQLSLTSDEVAEAKNLSKGSKISASKKPLPHEESGSEGSNAEITVSKRRKTRNQSKSRAKEGDSPSTITAVGTKGASTGGSGNDEWASKELLDVVIHMRKGDRSVLSRIELNQLILDYIHKHELRDRRNKSNVMCDSRLKKLFGKPRVGHIEMLDLLDPHILFTKEDSHKGDLQSTTSNGESKQLDADWNSDATVKSSKDKKRKSRKKGAKGLQSNLDDFAAIDMHNISMIYLRRNLVEELLEDTETFHEKAIGAFVRIRISGAGQKQDLYRLVQVTGTSKVAEPYKVGKRTTDFFLEILNLNKTELISIDIISNQEFTEDECKRLRQSIKCGLIGRLTVGDIQEKAMAFHAVRVNDWFESEIVRLSHLRDRASDTGRRKDLRECVEKLQLLKTPEERQRRLDEIPQIHSDPNMDPSHESEEDEDETDDRRNDNYSRSRSSNFGRKWGEAVSPKKGGFSSSDSWSGTRNLPGTNRELTRSLSSKDDSSRAVDVGNENLWILGRHRETQPPKSWDDKPKTPLNLETGARSAHNIVMPELSPKIMPEVSPAPSSGVPNAGQINETEKMWHYKDPSGKVQGPFSMAQLRKWNKNGYFPADLRIWKITETVDNSILLTDALAGKFLVAKVHSYEIPTHSLQSPTPNLTANGGTRGQPMESRLSSGSIPVANPLRGDTVSLQPNAVGYSVSANPALNSVLSAGNAPPTHSQLMVSSESQRMQINVQPSFNPSASLQNMVQPVHSHTVSGSISGPDMVASSSIPAGNLAASSQMGLPPVQGQSNVQPASLPNVPWNMGVTNNQIVASIPIAGNQTPGWGAMPGTTNMGWVAPVPMNANLNWGNNIQTSASANPGWAAPLQGQMAPMPGWVQPGQAPQYGNANAGWIPATGQGAVQGNANPGWAAPAPAQQYPGNSAATNEQNPNSDRGSHGGSKPFDRQRSFGNGGGSSRPPYRKGQVECPYYKSGRCKRGAQCDFMHT